MSERGREGGEGGDAGGGEGGRDRGMKGWGFQGERGYSKSSKVDDPPLVLTEHLDKAEVGERAGVGRLGDGGGTVQERGLSAVAPDAVDEVGEGHEEGGVPGLGGAGALEGGKGGEGGLAVGAGEGLWERK